MRKRIRVDNLGFITQDIKGRIERIDIEKSEMICFEYLSNIDRIKYLTRIPNLSSFITCDGKLYALIDVCIDWNAKCLTRTLRNYYAIEPYCDLNCGFCGPRKFEFDNYGKNLNMNFLFYVRLQIQAPSKFN
jgi:hypothetical protein